MKGNLRKTHLQSIDGFDVFVDDIYVYGYLSKEDIVYSSKGKVSCTIGEKGSSCLVLSTIRNLIHGTIGKNTLEGIHINFMHTIGLKFKEKGRILSTIEKIEDNIKTTIETTLKNNLS